jgi:hypothetical protein
VFTEPRGDASFLGALNKNDMVCVAYDQQADGRDWAFIAYSLAPGNQRKSLDAWGIMSALQPASAAEVATLNQAQAAAPAAPSTRTPASAAAAAPPSAPSAPPGTAAAVSPRTAQTMAPPPGIPGNAAPFAPGAPAAAAPQVPGNTAAPPSVAQQMPPGVPGNAAPPPMLAQPAPQVPGNSASPPVSAVPPQAPPSQTMTTPSTTAPATPSATSAPPPYQAPPAAQAAPSDNEVVRWSQPLTSGGYPVQGFSLEELVKGVPEYPPIDGLPEPVWRKTCNNCHQWTQQSLCVQAKIYAQNPEMAFRKQHPYGGPEKIAMMKWAAQGCQ